MQKARRSQYYLRSRNINANHNIKMQPDQQQQQQKQQQPIIQQQPAIQAAAAQRGHVNLKPPKFSGTAHENGWL